MKVKNFPARKLLRKLVAEKGKCNLDEHDNLALEAARQVRSKKNRTALAGKRKISL